MNKDNLGENVSALFQDFVRYQLTIRENIGIGDLNKIEDNNSLEIAASLSGADKFINKLSLGLDTELGYQFNGSQELSSGQWQKIAISRAFFSNSDIIILDEPTSALDPFAEIALFDTFMKLTEEKTAIFITHRLGSCKNVDRILVLKNGELVEEGNHENLMRQEGEYARMYTIQSNKYNQ